MVTLASDSPSRCRFASWRLERSSAIWSLGYFELLEPLPGLLHHDSQSSQLARRSNLR